MHGAEPMERQAATQRAQSVANHEGNSRFLYRFCSFLVAIPFFNACVHAKG